MPPPPMHEHDRIGLQRGQQIKQNNVQHNRTKQLCHQESSFIKNLNAFISDFHQQQNYRTSIKMQHRTATKKCVKIL